MKEGDRAPVSDISICEISRLVTIKDAPIFEMDLPISDQQAATHGKFGTVLLLANKLL